MVKLSCPFLLSQAVDYGRDINKNKIEGLGLGLARLKLQLLTSHLGFKC